jgi:predicted AAA+ superfamily ATPase
MKPLIEQLIVDFHERKLPEFIQRDIKLPCLKGKIDTIIGMRRTGKTFLLFQKMQSYIEQGIPKEAMLYINFDDERLLPLDISGLSDIGDSYFRLYPQMREQRCYFFFDEIQNIPGWENYCRRLIDTENIQLFVTGSSAKLLSKEIASSLRGRSISTEVFPFSFNEALLHQNITIPQHRPGTKKRSLIENRFREYLKQGGFPEIQGIAVEYQYQILQEYVDVVIFRDVIERYQVGNVISLRMLVRHLLSNASTLFSINKFYNDLKSQGITCGKNSLYEFFEYLNDAYLIYPISIYSRSERTKRVNPRKVYLIDTGLMFAYSHHSGSDWGKVLENFIFIQLRRKFQDICYYRTKSGYEVDFITCPKNGKHALFQVSFVMDEPKTKEREIRALKEAMVETNIDYAEIITMQEEEIINFEFGLIKIIPAWLWCLGDKLKPSSFI